MQKFESYHGAVNFLEGLANLPLAGDYMVDSHHADVYLARTRYFLNLIGNPDRGMRFIHVAGTSGKGTVTNMVHGALLAAGKKVGSFTSPFATTSVEKIKVQDRYVSPREFADIVDYLKPFIDRAYVDGPYGRPSYFEIFLAIALVHFARQACEWVVLEVGLGGRYDATNVIEHPVVTAITNIDYDHTEILGKTLAKIAYDKAGIIKAGAAFFTTEQRASILKIFGDVCREKSVQVQRLPHQKNYQAYNVELATAIAQHVGVNDASIVRGIAAAHLPCRFEVVQRSPMVVLDGAHNRAKVHSTIANLESTKFSKLHLVIGIADNKDHAAILGQLVPRAAHVCFTRFQVKDRQCAHPKALAAKSKKYLRRGARTEVFLDPNVALDAALVTASPKDLILVVGSFYLAGELRKRWISEDYVLAKRRAF